MGLFHSHIPAIAFALDTKQVAIKFQTAVCVAYSNSSMIDAKEQSSISLLPFVLTFAFWKIDQLKIMHVGIMKIKCFYSGGRDVAGWYRLRPRGYMHDHILS